MFTIYHEMFITWFLWSYDYGFKAVKTVQLTQVFKIITCHAGQDDPNKIVAEF